MSQSTITNATDSVDYCTDYDHDARTNLIECITIGAKPGES